MPLFRSFWMAGYESATHLNMHGERLDMIAGIQHDIQAESDYALLPGVGIRTARDAVRWHLVDRGGFYDFSSFEPMLNAALSQGIQVIWDLCHYGYPDGLDIYSGAFVDRFATYAGEVARFIREHTDEVPFFSPVNEINFYSWAASRDFMFPFGHGRDNEIKQQLVRACIAGVEAIWSVDPRARITYPEPVIHVMPPRDRPDLAGSATAYRESQFDAWDMIAGRKHPELGGHPKYLDIPGANFYDTNQWEIEGNGRLRWDQEPRDERWRPLNEMLAEISTRYNRPLYIGETSHVGSGRARWIREIAYEAKKALQAGVPLEGICLYPILDRYDWGNVHHWHNSGLWDLRLDSTGIFERVLNTEYAEALAESKTLIEV